MNTEELIPMEEPYRQQLKDRYLKPLKYRLATMFLLMVGILVVIIGALWSDKGPNYFALLFLIPLGYFGMLFYLAISKYNLHYYQDYQFGFIIKEQMTVIKVFHTPSGINIYWLDSNDIKTFTPNPYRHFSEGEQVMIYYLKYSKEYLAYEA